jgi:hypothetical protein
MSHPVLVLAPQQRSQRAASVCYLWESETKVRDDPYGRAYLVLQQGTCEVI